MTFVDGHGSVDLSVRKRKAPDSDDLSLQNPAKRTKENAVVVQEL